MTTHKTFESILNWETLDYSYVKRSNALTWQKRQPKKDIQPHPALLLFKMAAQRELAVLPASMSGRAGASAPTREALLRKAVHGQ